MMRLLNYWLSAIFMTTALFSTTTYGQTPSTIKWQSCENSTFKTWFNSDIPPDLQCATLNVPVNAEKPNQGQFKLALTRYPTNSLDSDAKPNLLIIAGGPGENSLTDINNILDDNVPYRDELTQNFNIIGFAPRGVSPSTPKLRCDTDLPYNQSFVKSCEKLTGKSILHAINSQSASEDIDRIRQALGDDKLSAIGYSYGTKVLALYALHHPDNVRAGVFDGVVDINQDMFGTLYDQEVGFQQSFERFVDFCQTQSQCYFQKDKNTQSTPNQQFQQFLQRLEQQNLTDLQGNPITPNQVLSLFNNKLIWHKLWQDLAVMIAELDKGKTARYNYLLEYTDEKDAEPQDDRETDKHPNSSLLAHVRGEDDSYLVETIDCADYAPWTPEQRQQRQHEYINRMKAIDNASPYNNYYQKSPQDYLDTCYFWGKKGADSKYSPPSDTALPQLVFISETHDPTTPHKNGVAMSKFFHSPLITRVGDGHVASFNEHYDQCINQLVVNYLLSPNTPIESQTCEAKDED